MGETDGALEYHLQRLGPDALAALVADLWAARGFETTHDGRFVHARRGDERVVIRITDRARPRPPSDVDVVVAPRVRGTAPGPETLDAARLRDLLRYAVAPATTDRLCARHLGAPLASLGPPPTARLRARLRAGLAPSPLPFAVLVLVALAGLTGAALTDPAPSTAPLPASETPSGTTPTPVEVPPSPTPADDLGMGFPPGVTEAGLADPERLAAAHRRALSGRSYTLWTDTYRPENETRVQYDWDLTVADGRYLLRASVGDDDRRPLRTVYYDGSAWSVAESPGGNTTYRRVDADGAAPLGPNPFTLAETLVLRYLDAPETTVYEARGTEDAGHYRLVARGVPRGFDDRVEAYEAVALVTPEGLVSDLTVRYTRLEGGERDPVRFEATYGRLDATVVAIPGWYGWEFENATSTPAG
jgi:hypothetical protein